MTRNGLDNPAPYDFVGRLIAHEADAFARRWGLDAERVRQILVQTTTDYDGQPLPEASPFRDNLDHGLRFDPSLNEAFAYLDPNDALNLFEQTDPVVVARRARLVAYLGDPSSPSCTSAELADTLEAALGHLERNRPELLATGYPRTGFAGSRWLDWHLTLLSPTKIPVSAFAEGHPTATDFAGERQRIQRQIANLRTLFELGELTKDEFLGRRERLNRAIEGLRPHHKHDGVLERAASFLGDVPAAWRAASDEQRNALARLLFSEVRIKDVWVVAVGPQPSFAPFFDLDCQARRLSSGSDGDRLRMGVMVRAISSLPRHHRSSA